MGGFLFTGDKGGTKSLHLLNMFSQNSSIETLLFLAEVSYSY